MTSHLDILRADFLKILKAALNAADPSLAVHRHIHLHGDVLKITSHDRSEKSLSLTDYDRIFVIGAGKATAPMAEAFEALLGNRITDGIIIVKDGHMGQLTRVRQFEASHPLPDARGMDAAGRIYHLAKNARKNDLIISLISGGGSSLLTLPAGISLDEKISVTNILLRCGASIAEINCVRKHLSQLKGGLLARAAYPATVLNFLISDVVGDDVSSIASGPFSPDTSTYTDAMRIIHSYQLADKIPTRAMKVLHDGAEGKLPETGKPGDAAFDKVTTTILTSNIQALREARQQAELLGYRTLILSSMLEGDTSEAALFHGRIAREIHKTGNPLPRPACIISGGETTVRVQGNGLGGRNMEFVLRCAIEIDGIPNTLVASIGTDGTDGPTDAAGAIADGTTRTRVHDRGLIIEEYLANNDSYHLFEALGDLVKTGPTKTNVMDIRIILAR